jgi:hypothetical protein
MANDSKGVPLYGPPTTPPSAPKPDTAPKPGYSVPPPRPGYVPGTGRTK